MPSIYVIVFALLSFSVAAQSPKITEDKNHDWSQHPSFHLEEGELVTVMKEEVDRAKILAAIRQSIREQMESKGYKEEGAESAKLKISFTAEVVETENIADVGPLGQTPADDPADVDRSRVWSQERRQGSVAIDISRNGDGKSVWRSSVTVDFGSEDLAVALRAATFRAMRKMYEQKK